MNRPEVSHAHLAGQARQVFVRQVIDDLPQVVQRLLDDLQGRAEQAHFPEAAQRIDDARVRLTKLSPLWLDGCRARLTASLRARDAVPTTGAGPLSLLDDDRVENQILAARAALVAVDKGNEALNELRLRLQRLELTDELDTHDPVLALNVVQALVDAWVDAGMTRADWHSSQSAMHGLLARVIAEGYAEANRFLLSRGVLPEIDLRDLVRRGGRASSLVPTPVAPRSTPPVADRYGPAVPATTTGLGGLTHVMPLPVMNGATGVGSGPAVDMGGGPWAPSMSSEAYRQVLQRLNGFLAQQVPGWEGMVRPTAGAATGGYATGGAASGGASSARAGANGGAWWAQVQLPPMDWSSVEAGMQGARVQAQVLKQAARSDAEKALIEMVALIFDHILAEDRIPAGVRVWFARLQMPVLRHALEDATFLTDEQHPARALIDRLGACVLGFDPSAPMDALEAEIKRIVQVIEQYPETGRRVFELMLQEFEAFLGRALADEPRLKRVSDVAGQLEQRAALTVQYTIEMRRLLDPVPVHDGLRQFLFHTWVEVMAHAVVAFGADDARAQAARALAGDLLWATSAKPQRQERAQVIARVPALMAQIHEGLAWIGMDGDAQQRAAQPVGDALAAAFVSRGPVVDAAQLAGLTDALTRLEGVLAETDDPVTLSRDSLEWLLGRDASDIIVLPDTAHTAPKHLLAWAAALPVGSWYALEHNGVRVQVRLGWVSPRHQLYLFQAGTQGAYLMQQGRVGQYLKAGLLKAVLAEPLTREATRQALDKLQANPERLLA